MLDAPPQGEPAPAPTFPFEAPATQPTGRLAKRQHRDGGGPWNEHARRLAWAAHPYGYSGPIKTAPLASVPSEAALILTVEQSAEICRPSMVLTRCACSLRGRRCGCNRINCVECVGVIGRRRARRLLLKLLATVDAAREGTHTHDPALWSVRFAVFTMPPAVRGRYLSSPQIGALRRELAEVLKRDFGAAWAVIMPHPVGDEDPTAFHPHLNVAWGTGRLGPGVMPPAELARLKERWRELLQVGDEGAVDVRVWFRRRPEEVEITNDLVYLARGFAGWARWCPKWCQWYGKTAKVEEEKPSHVCPECGQPEVEVATGAAAERAWREAAARFATGPPPEEPLWSGEAAELRLDALRPEPEGTLPVRPAQQGAFRWRN